MTLNAHAQEILDDAPKGAIELEDDALNDLAESLEGLRRAFQPHHLPIVAMADVGGGFIGPTASGSKERCPPELVLLKLLLDDDVSVEQFYGGFDHIEQAYNEHLAGMSSWHATDEQTDAAQQAVHRFVQVCDRHQIPALICAHFGRYGEGAESAPHRLLESAGGACDRMTGYDAILAAMQPDLEELKEDQRQRALVKLVEGMAEQTVH